tara:strand:+ start:155 stop:541 length:387 start_codon:yes stop_codon:yes gene_type:complete
MAVSKTRLIAALEKTGGLVSHAAKVLGCSRQAIYKRMEKDASGDIAAALVDIREMTLDIAEAALLTNIKAGKSQDVRFYLETLGKGRGFVKRTETTGVEGGPIKLDLSGISDADLARLEKTATEAAAR